MHAMHTHNLERLCKLYNCVTDFRTNRLIIYVHPTITGIILEYASIYKRSVYVTFNLNIQVKDKREVPWGMDAWLQPGPKNPWCASVTGWS